MAMEAAPGRSAEPGREPGQRVATDSRLHSAAQQLLAVQRSAMQLVRKAEEERRGREAAAERLAELLAEVDAEAYDRVMAAVRAAGRAEMRSARTLAREMLALATKRALDALSGYPGVTRETQDANRAIERQAERLASALAPKSPEAAAAVRASFQRAADTRLESAARRDREVVGAIRKAARDRKQREAN